ncbi:uncharacterized protein ZBAI_03861 [Zygosaccharomyces bailii ISA1307]|nr:uncharacterized protein ZBAI_03861 [Zygosaccharomyces bailii ISA1307]
MGLQELVAGILQEDGRYDRRSRTLIFALGDTARMHVETQLKPASGMLSSVTAVIRSRRNVEVLFLNRLQYLFMYLMKLEVEAECYNSLVLYGLDELISDGTGGTLKPEQLHLANLVFNAVFRIKRKHHLQAVTFITIIDSPQLKMLEDYWRHVC